MQEWCKDSHCSLIHEQEIGWHGDTLAASREVGVDDVLECFLRDISQLSRRVPPVWELHTTHSRPRLQPCYMHCNVCMGQ